MKRSLTYLSLLVLLVGSSPLVFGQPFGPGEGGFKGIGPGAADGSRIITKLNRALEAATGPLLNENGQDQEAQIAALLEEMRASRPTPDLENRGSGFMTDYGAAILDGNLGAISEEGGIADQIAAAMAERTATRLVKQAEFQIAVLKILSPEQITALKDQFGEQGLLMLLNSRGRGGKWGRGGGRQAGPEGFSRERMRGSLRGEISTP
jgi:hypothetical protein